MNNTDLNYMGPRICRFFSTVYTTVLQLSGWLNLQIGKKTEKLSAWRAKIYLDFQLCGGSVPYPRAVHRSTVLIYFFFFSLLAGIHMPLVFFFFFFFVVNFVIH